MKKLLTMFALGTSMMFASCGNNSKTADNKIIQLEQPGNNNQTPPCVVEVPCNEPELSVSGHENLRKFYDFCDSTVTVTWSSRTYGFSSVHDHETRPMSELHGTEKMEMQQASAKYQALNHH